VRRFFAELLRRKAVRIIFAYAVVGWLIIQVAAAIVGPLQLPGWSLTLLIVLVAAGLPIAVILAWSAERPRAGEGATSDAGPGSSERPAGEPIPAGAAAGRAPTDGHAADGESPAPRSIAVLPFADMSPERDQAYLCEGLAEEILNTLTRLPELRVASRTASFQFAGKGADVGEIGRRLKVANVLEGSVRKSGDRLRVTAQLIDTSNGFHLWSERFDSECSDIFDIQDEIAGRVASALQLAPVDEPGAGRTSNFEAYDYYLKGWKYFHTHSRHGLQHARQMFRRAVELDPDFARAWAGLADAAAFAFQWFGRGEDDRREALETSEKALDLCDTCAETHASRGFAFMINEEYDRADACFERAIDINPGLFEPYYFYARSAVHQGKLEQAAELFERAHEIDPEDFQSALLLTTIHRKLGRQEELDRWARRGVEAALRRLDREPDDVRATYLAAGGLILMGERERALELARRALELQPEDPATLYNVACVYSQAGLLDEALDLLERGAGLGSGSMYSRSWLEHDFDLAPLADLPRFQEFLAGLE
jgi:adenylate cyclase